MTKDSTDLNEFCDRGCCGLIQFNVPATRWYDGKYVGARTCNGCGYVGFQPPPEEILSEYYSNCYGKSANAWYNVEADYAREKVNSRSNDVSRLLDKYRLPEAPVIFEIGCAFGGTVQELRDRGFTAFGSDLNSDAISQGRMRGNTNIFNASAMDALDALGQRANLMYSYHALEHFPNPAAFLNSLRPFLADQSVLEFRVPNGAYLRAWFEGFEQWDWFAFPDHLHLFTPRSLLCLAEKSGYDLLAVRSNGRGEPIEVLTHMIRFPFVSSPVQLSAFFSLLAERHFWSCELRFEMCLKGSPISQLFADEIAQTRAECLGNASMELAVKALVRNSRGVNPATDSR